MSYFSPIGQQSICSFCNKPYAYALPLGWYTPPITPNPTWTITTTDHTTMLTFTGNAQPANYCYGHTFVRCTDCGMLVAYMYHSPESCAFLRGLKQGLDDIREGKTIPLAECLSEHVDVPGVFQDAFAEKELL